MIFCQIKEIAIHIMTNLIKTFINFIILNNIAFFYCRQIIVKINIKKFPKKQRMMKTFRCTPKVFVGIN